VEPFAQAYFPVPPLVLPRLIEVTRLIFRSRQADIRFAFLGSQPAKTEDIYGVLSSLLAGTEVSTFVPMNLLYSSAVVEPCNYRTVRRGICGANGHQQRENEPGFWIWLLDQLSQLSILSGWLVIQGSEGVFGGRLAQAARRSGGRLDCRYWALGELGLPTRLRPKSIWPVDMVYSWLRKQLLATNLALAGSRSLRGLLDLGGYNCLGRGAVMRILIIASSRTLYGSIFFVQIPS
jgi:hypothetical protein